MNWGHSFVKQGYWDNEKEAIQRRPSGLNVVSFLSSYVQMTGLQLITMFGEAEELLGSGISPEDAGLLLCSFFGSPYTQLPKQSQGVLDFLMTTQS